MNDNRPKENENPIIHDVSSDNDTQDKNKNLLGWSEINALNVAEICSISTSPYNGKSKEGKGFVLDSEKWMLMMNENNENNKTTTATTIDDVAIIRAISDASAATDGEGVSILRNSGVLTNNKNNVSSENNSHHSFVSSNITALLLRHQKQQKSREDDSEEEKDDQRNTTANNPKHQQQKKQESTFESMDSSEIFEIIRQIQDPEHPSLTLEQLGVVKKDQIDIQHPDNNEMEGICSLPTVDVRFTPTVPHCSMATLIGLCIRVKLHRSLPRCGFKVQVRIQPGTHSSENAVNKQLADKERVCAALENKHLLNVVNKCIAGTNTG